MKENTPFTRIGFLSEQELADARTEINKLAGWCTSEVPMLMDKRDYIALCASKVRSANVYNSPRSENSADSGGTFNWKTQYEFTKTLRAVANNVLTLLDSKHLGSVMVSRMQPDAHVTRHRDWSPYYFMHHRVQICIAANPETEFHCDNMVVRMQPGEMWLFSNCEEHEVINRGPNTRVAYVVDVMSRDCVPSGAASVL